MAQGTTAKITVVNGYADLTPVNPTPVLNPVVTTGNVTIGGVLAVTGATSMNGTLINTGVVTAAGGVLLGTSTLSNYDENGTLVGSWSGGFVAAQTLNVTRIGRMINIKADASATSVGVAAIATYSLTLPTAFRPSAPRTAAITIESGGAGTKPFGTLSIATNGTLTLSQLTASNFSAGVTSGAYPFNVAFIV